MHVDHGSYSIDHFRFASGETMSNTQVGYATVGSPSKDADGSVTNAVLLLHNTGGSYQLFLAPGHAKPLFGPDGALDPEKYFVIMPDALGHGRSSKPSDGLRGNFPHYTYRDMVSAQHRLVTEHFGIRHLRLVIGASMGGMHTWMWSQTFPDMMRAVMPIGSQPQPVRGRNLLWRRIVVNAIRDAPDYDGGFYQKQPSVLATGLAVMTMAAAGIADLETSLPDTTAADDLIEGIRRSIDNQQDANDVLYQLDSSEDYDPSVALEAIDATLLALNFVTDRINPFELGDVEAAIKKVRRGGMINVPPGPEPGGHESVLTPGLWAPYVRTFLDATA